MSKIQQIKDMLQQGKVSVKATEYLLWVMEQKEVVSRLRNQAAQMAQLENRMHVHAANSIDDAIKSFDQGKIQKWEYDKTFAWAMSLVGK